MYFLFGALFYTALFLVLQLWARRLWNWHKKDK